MAAKHGTRRCYNEGCRCGDCKDANAAYQQEYRQRPTAVIPLSTAVTPPICGPGPVESGVEAEISGLAAEARPGLAAVALELARVMDNPKAVNQKAAAAKVLATTLDKLHAVSARGRRGNLALVRQMSEKGGA
jgi:hypothetical protein